MNLDGRIITIPDKHRLRKAAAEAQPPTQLGIFDDEDAAAAAYWAAAKKNFGEFARAA
jgi:hypothetical protein